MCEDATLKIPMTKVPNPNQIPSSNDQIPKKRPLLLPILLWVLGLGIWSLIGIWALGHWSFPKTHWSFLSERFKIPMTKEPNPNQIPRPNDQIPKKRSLLPPTLPWVLDLGIWSLIGIWALGHWSFLKHLTPRLSLSTICFHEASAHRCFSAADDCGLPA
jgi:hypothetical protein